MLLVDNMQDVCSIMSDDGMQGESCKMQVKCHNPAGVMTGPGCPEKSFVKKNKKAFYFNILSILIKSFIDVWSSM